MATDHKKIAKRGLTQLHFGEAFFAITNDTVLRIGSNNAEFRLSFRPHCPRNFESDIERKRFSASFNIIFLIVYRLLNSGQLNLSPCPFTADQNYIIMVLTQLAPLNYQSSEQSDIRQKEYMLLRRIHASQYVHAVV